MSNDDDLPGDNCPKCLGRGGCPYCLGSDPGCQICSGKNVCCECLRTPAPGSPAERDEAASGNPDNEEENPT